MFKVTTEAKVIATKIDGSIDKLLNVLKLSNIEIPEDISNRKVDIGGIHVPSEYISIYDDENKLMVEYSICSREQIEVDQFEFIKCVFERFGYKGEGGNGNQL